jgi:drug/metabolite transporter (DMT)-like permease
MVRSLTGTAGFFLLMAACGMIPQLRAAVRNREGMKFTALTTLFGPFIGVSLSLMAVQYARAGIASTLMALTPVLIIVPYALIHKQKISVKEVIGTLITMVGVALFFLL